MLWLKSAHIIFMVTWFSGLFYLPRLYVYHAMSQDQISIERFIVMERKLLFGITTPGGILTTITGLWLFSLNSAVYLQQAWMHAKLLLVLILWLYHGYLLLCWRAFKHHRNKHNHVFYRWLNEFSVLILACVVVLVIVKPF